MAIQMTTRGTALVAGLAAVLVALPVAAAPTPPPSTPTPDVQRAGFIATMDAEFRRKDADGDGKLTRGEIEQNERNAIMTTAMTTNRQIFAQLDTDRNGQLSPAEFAKLVAAPATPDVTPMMTRIDTNRDQIISLVEYRAATLANFDRLDTDHDGVVTAAEMRNGGLAPSGR